MQWSSEAEAAIKKVPFFVRKRVRARVEKEAQETGKTVVSLDDVRATQERYLARMGEEVKGYQLETCFGSGGCPNRALVSDRLVQRLEKVLNKAQLRRFLKGRVKGGLKHHHEFRVTVADCPNACSQPQIKDVGIIGAQEPTVTSEPCVLCAQCTEACQEKAIMLQEKEAVPIIEYDRCVRCGKCIGACPTGTLAPAREGYRVLLGGKLGRHPRLAQEIPGIYAEDDVVQILQRCLSFYKRESRHGERFAEIYHDSKCLDLPAPTISREKKPAE